MFSFKQSRLYHLLEQQTCKGHARLLSRALDHRLNPFERLSLHLHSFLCPPCHRHANQMQILEEARRWVWSGENGHGSGLTDESRQRILASLD